MKYMTDNEITYEIRGAIYDVYKELGPGLLESVYEEGVCETTSYLSATDG